MSQFPSNPPFGQQPGNAPSASSGPAPQQPGQPAWGSQAQPPQQQPGQPAWAGQQQNQYGQQPGYYAPPAPTGPAAISKLTRLLVVIAFGVFGLAALFNFIAMVSSGYGPGAMTIIVSLLQIGAWATLTFGAWKAFDLVDTLIAKSDADKA